MNRLRVASLLRALADEFDGRRDTPAGERKKNRRPPPPPISLPTTREPSELHRAMARKELVRLGYRPGPKRGST